MKLFRIGILFLLLSSCGLSTGSGDSEIPIDPFTALQSGQIDSQSRFLLTGSGELLFNTVANGALTSQSYFVEFELNDDGSQVTLITFSNNDLSGGIEVQFERSGLDLVVSVTSGGSAVDISSPSFSAYSATGVLSFVLEIDNSQSPAAVYIWPVLDSYSENNTSYNSTVDLPAIPSASGNGLHWGLSFTNAKVTRALLSSPLL